MPIGRSLCDDVIFPSIQVLVEPGFGEDVRLQPPLSPPSPPRIKHKSHGEPIQLTPTKLTPIKKPLRVRHNSEPFKQGQNLFSFFLTQQKQLLKETHRKHTSYGCFIVCSLVLQNDVLSLPLLPIIRLTTLHDSRTSQVLAATRSSLRHSSSPPTTNRSCPSLKEVLTAGGTNNMFSPYDSSPRNRCSVQCTIAVDYTVLLLAFYILSSHSFINCSILLMK